MTTLPPLNAPAAYAQGWRAAQRGEPVTANPFSKRSYRRQWLQGHKDAPR